MSKRIRAGLIGCGGISRQHIGALMQMDNAEIVAVCDIKPDRLAAAAAQTGGAEPLGPLPGAAIALLAGLAGAWLCMGAYAAGRAVKRRHAVKRQT